MWRGAGGLKGEDFWVRRNWDWTAEVSLDILCNGSGCGLLRVSPSGGGESTAAIVVAATRAVDGKLCGF